MKYRHRFHAGNFADTVKHLVLYLVLKALRNKPAPFFVLDTHAGSGRYQLAGDVSEYESGFAKLRGRTELPAALMEFVAAVERIGTDADASLQFYPGSPLIAAHMLRPCDRAALYEIREAEAEKLRVTMRAFRNITVQCGDGYGAVRSTLPPAERRGLVLIDPAYELQEKEFPLVLSALTEAHRRWSTGIFAIWYPIKRRAAVAAFHETLQATGIRRILCAELSLYRDDSRVSLNGCGMLVVNPPWQLDRELRQTLPILHELLEPQPATKAECFWLTPE